MKKRLFIMLVLMVTVILGSITSAFADSAAFDMDTADYYVYVATPDSGLNLREGPGTGYKLVMDNPIPNGAKLYILYVSEDWGYTEYNGNIGWVALKQTQSAPSAPPEETFSKEKVDYYVYVNAPDGGLRLRQGPGKSYPVAMKGYMPNNEKLHIEYVSGDWGYTKYSRYEGESTDSQYEGWLYLPQTSKDSAPSVAADSVEPADKVDVSNDLTTQSDSMQEPKENSAKNSMLSQIKLGTILIVVIVIAATVLLILVNKKSKR